MSPKIMLRIGWTLSALAGLFMLTSGINLIFIRSADLVETFNRFAYPNQAITAIGWCALISSILYLIPQTSVLGAILLTGYLGGAVATHVRISDPTFFVPVIVGVLLWLGLYLRDERLRQVLPLRS